MKKGKDETACNRFTGYEYNANGNTVKRTIYGQSGTTIVEFVYDTMNLIVRTEDKRLSVRNCTFCQEDSNPHPKPGDTNLFTHPTE